MRNSNTHRILMLLLTLITLVTILPGVAFAADGTDEYISAMNNKIYYWYVLIRNHIAFPLLGISYAWCGFCFLGSGFIAKKEFSADAVKSRFWKSSLALLVLLLIPYLFSWATKIVRPNAWVPPEGDGYLDYDDPVHSGLFGEDGALSGLIPEEDDLLFVTPGKHRFDSTYFEYWAFIPEDPKENMPLVVYLHGDSSVGDMEAVGNNRLVNAAEEIYDGHYPFICVAPCTTVRSWISGDIPDDVAALTQMVKRQYKCSKVIIVGMSRGATGAWNMIDKHCDLFDAAVLISSGTPSGWNAENAANVPVRAFAGDEGSEVRYGEAMQNAVEKITKFGGNAKFTTLEGISHYSILSVVFTEELIEWMVSQ